MRKIIYAIFILIPAVCFGGQFCEYDSKTTPATDDLFILKDSADSKTKTTTYGNLSTTVSATIVGGADTQVQYNDGGSAFGGDNGLAWDKTSRILKQRGGETQVDAALNTLKGVESLDDTQEYTLPAATYIGRLWVTVEDGEHAHALVGADGTVTLIFNSANIGTTNDTDAKLNIYDGGSAAVIENQLGSTKRVQIIFCYE